MTVNAGRLNGGLPTYTTGKRSTGWWAMLLVIFIEIVVFSSLIASYFYLFSSAPEWPLNGIDPPKLLLPTVNALILFVSAGLAWWGDRALAHDDTKAFTTFRLIADAALVVFLVLKYIEYSGLPYRWDDNAYASIVWTIAGFHTTHVITVLLKSLVIDVLGIKGFFTSRRRSAVQGATLYWIFVAVVWVPLFATIYIFPHLL